MKKTSCLISCVILGVSLSFSALAKGNDNFRLALPDGYSVISYQANENIDGGSVKFAPDSDLESNSKILHLQSYLSQYMPKEMLRLSKNSPRSFSKKVLSAKLGKECANFEVNVGRVRHYNDGSHVNWWSACETLSDGNHYEFERGRVYVSSYGTYIYSHIESKKGKDFKFSVKEVQWFDRYLNSSALCESGKDCGLQGKLVREIFVQQ